MYKICTLMAFVALLLAACSSSSRPTPTPEPPRIEASKTVPPTVVPTVVPTETALPTAEPTLTPTATPLPTAEPALEPTAVIIPTPPDYAGLPLPIEKGTLFSTSGICAVCHANMQDPSGADVSIDSFWRSTMMANAARDPYWQASVSAEVLAAPDYQEIIEDKCSTCHMPMARFTAFAAGSQGQIFEDGLLEPAHELHAMALDGVSCALCHQITKTSFGQPESYGGAYVIETQLPAGERVTYGPFRVGRNLAAIMQSGSGFIPRQGIHVQQSELCATCHTLYTPYLDAAGQIAGEFPEQTPYLEWLSSDYRDSAACQTCHMPQAQGGVVLSITGGPPREPFRQHAFVGGNTYVLGLLQRFGDEMSTTASSEQFGATIQRLTDQLQNRTATVALEDVNVVDSRLTATVVVENQTGHKLPTAYPSRRVWLHFTVRDAGGQVVFESGAPNPDGSITHNDNDTDPSSYEAHYLTINSSDQVQIYEAIMENTEGEVTTTLLRGAGYVKDNRLLPTGFDSANDDIGVYGQASADADFGGGGDQIIFEIPLNSASGPFTVAVELLYQSIGYRWSENLRRQQSPEITRFHSYQQALPNLPEVIASATAETGN